MAVTTSQGTYDPTKQQVVPVQEATTKTNVTEMQVDEQGRPVAEMSKRVQEAMAQIKQLYPDYAFFFEPDAGGFGEDVRRLLIQAIEEKWTATKFDAAYKQTKYYKETSDKARAWNAKGTEQKNQEIDAKLADLQADYADLFDFEGADKVAREIATNVARLGLSGNRLKTFVFAEALRLTPAGAKAPTLETNEADTLRNTVREFGYIPSDDEINAALTGKPDRKGMLINKNTLIERAKNAAKGLYPHLSQQLDAGLSLDDVFKNYRTYASQILELDPNEIDFVKDPKWSEAFGNEKTGMLSLSSWQEKLKSDPKYGWRFTKQANQQVSSVVSTLERAFGLVI